MTDQVQMDLGLEQVNKMDYAVKEGKKINLLQTQMKSQKDMDIDVAIQEKKNTLKVLKSIY